MADWFDGNEQEIDFTPPRRRIRPFGVFLTLIIIAGLLGSGILGVYWLINRQNESLLPTTLEVPTAPDFSPNRIAFINPEGQVVTIAPDGRDQHILTQDDLTYIFPVWSPDGRFLAAIGSQTPERGVYLLEDSESQTSRELYASDAQGPFYLYWSPDSHQVSFLADQSRGNLGLYIAGVEPGATTQLIQTGSPFYWDWLADSSRMLIHTGFAGEQAQLGMLDVETQELVQEIGSPGFFQAPGISADGRYLAYARENQAGGSSVVVANADGEIIMQEQHAGMTAMSWHPAANQLAFISATRNNGRFFGPLRLIDVDKGEVDLLTNETVLAFFWSPDGRYLAIIHVGILNGNEDIAQKENRAHLSKPVAQRFQLPELTLAILDVDSRTTVQSMTFQPTERFFTQFLPFFDQYALSHRLWSPQSDAVALPMRVDDNPQVVVISVADGRQQTIGEGDMPFWSP